MKLHKSPSFRKMIIPWHDSNIFCLVILIFSALLFYLSIAGITVALEYDQYQRYCWVPIMLMLFSGMLLVVNLFRILRSLISRFKEE